MGDKVLELKDLINIKYIPEINEISLKLLIDFYETYLCKKVFVFSLSNGEIVKLFFKDTSEIFHISGIEHIYGAIPMDGCRFIKEIKENKIDFSTIEAINPGAYKDYVNRIRSMYCIDTIIKNCEYLYYPKHKIPKSEIKVSYLLLKGLDGKNLHLGIDTYKPGRPYFTRTLLITEGGNARKFIDLAADRLKVVKLEIRDKDSDIILECIQREAAERYVNTEILESAEEWRKDNFNKILLEFFTQEDFSTLFLDIYEKIVERDIENIHQDIKYLVNNKEEFNLQEWKDLMEILLQENLPEFLESVKLSYSDVVEIKHICVEQANNRQKNQWMKLLKNYIDLKKDHIRTKANKLDPYWSGKIVGEGVRAFEKKEIKPFIDDKIYDFIEMQFDTLKIFYQKDIIEKHLKEIIRKTLEI